MFTRGLIFDLTPDTIKVQMFSLHNPGNILNTMALYIHSEGGLSPLEDAVHKLLFSSEKSLPGHKAEIFLREFCFRHGSQARCWAI